MAKRAKRATRPNPREDRNEFGTRSTRRRRGTNTSNVIEVEFQPERNKKVNIVPRSLNQETLLADLEDENKHIVFAIGPAGSGKSYIVTLYAIKMLKAKLISKIVVTRPNIAVDDNDIGYLPGDIMAKMAPWVAPILDIFAEFYSQAEIKNMIENKVLECVPVAFIRGRTFKDAIVIVDEAQGTTRNSMLSILTRIGENSKMVVTGDVRQSDRGTNNGLQDFIDRFKDQSDMISVVEFEHKDVVRHPVIKDVLKIYGEEE